MNMYEMIQRYVEERFSTYSDFASLKAAPVKNNDDEVLIRFDSFVNFTENISKEVSNIFKVNIEVRKLKIEDLNNSFTTIYQTNISYDNTLVSYYGFSIENNLLYKYERGNDYDKIN